MEENKDASGGKFETRAVQTGTLKDDTYNSVITPIYPTSIFYFEDLGVTKGFDYTRTDNPTRLALEENIASLEGGVGARVTASGMAAISTAMYIFSPGDHIIAPRDIYGGTFRLFKDILPRYGLTFSFVNMCDVENVQSAIRPETRCIWIETPSNPLLCVTDIRAITEIARERGIITIADNTFLSPYFQRPIELGVDVVVHSTTKYINGHSDIIGGAIVSSTNELHDKMRYYTNALGTTGSPFDAWLQLRGIKTLPLRMEAHQRGAIAIAHFLKNHEKSARVYYPGLEDNPGHELMKLQSSGFGGIVSFDLDAEESMMSSFFKALRIFHLSGSLGGIESLVSQPWSMSHNVMPSQDKIASGLTPMNIRISVGIEHPDDLIAALDDALKSI